MTEIETSVERVTHIFGFLVQIYEFKQKYNRYANTVEFHNDNIIIIVKLKITYGKTGFYQPVLVLIKHQYYIRDTSLIYSTVPIDELDRLIKGGKINMPKPPNRMFDTLNIEYIYLRSARTLVYCLKFFPQLKSLGVFEPEVV